MQYIQGTTTAATFAGAIAQMNEINRLRRENERMRSENEALHQLMYAVQGESDEKAEMWRKMCFNMAGAVSENDTLRAEVARLDGVVAELATKVIELLAR